MQEQVRCSGAATATMYVNGVLEWLHDFPSQGQRLESSKHRPSTFTKFNAVIDSMTPLYSQLFHSLRVQCMHMRLPLLPCQPGRRCPMSRPESHSHDSRAPIMPPSRPPPRLPLAESGPSVPRPRYAGSCRLRCHIHHCPSGYWARSTARKCGSGSSKDISKLLNDIEA